MITAVSMGNPHCMPVGGLIFEAKDPGFPG